MTREGLATAGRVQEWGISGRFAPRGRAVVRYPSVNVAIPLLLTMLIHTLRRRVLGSVLIALGAVMMWLAPEVWIGLVMILIAVALEILGITLERRAR